MNGNHAGGTVGVVEASVWAANTPTTRTETRKECYGTGKPLEQFNVVPRTDGSLLGNKAISVFVNS